LEARLAHSMQSPRTAWLRVHRPLARQDSVELGARNFLAQREEQ